MAIELSRTENEPNFGTQLYDAFCTAGRMDLVTQAFSYDAIQRLKHADRDEVLRLYTGKMKWDFVQRLKVDSPEEVVEYLIVSEQQKTERQTRFHFIFLIPMLLLINYFGLRNAIEHGPGITSLFVMPVINAILSVVALGAVAFAFRRFRKMAYERDRIERVSLLEQGQESIEI